MLQFNPHTGLYEPEEMKFFDDMVQEYYNSNVENMSLIEENALINRVSRIRNLLEKSLLKGDKEV